VRNENWCRFEMWVSWLVRYLKEADDIERLKGRLLRPPSLILIVPFENQVEAVSLPFAFHSFQFLIAFDLSPLLFHRRLLPHIIVNATPLPSKGLCNVPKHEIATLRAPDLGTRLTICTGPSQCRYRRKGEVSGQEGGGGGKVPAFH